MTKPGLLVLFALSLLTSPSFIRSVAQPLMPLERLPAEVLDIMPPSARVTGEPGTMRITERSCRALPLEQVRRRIVDTAVQEWAYFGFNVEEPVRANTGSNDPGSFRRPAMSVSEARRLSGSIAGYWSATPNSDWILQRQNENWNRNGIDTRWRDAWSAAFVSWVMCESGLGSSSQFKRAIAHHSYIDQAILARDGKDQDAVYKAWTPGEQAMLPGDLICRGSRPEYRTLDQRRNQMGIGARTHCDIIVKIDEDRHTIQAVGGNVRGSVRMKLLPALQSAAGHLYPESDRGRVLFAHLQLTAAAIEVNAMDNSPTLLTMTCAQLPASLVTAGSDKESAANTCQASR